MMLGLLLRGLGNVSHRSHFKAGVFIILAVVIGYLIFMELPLNESSMLGELQGRMELTDGGFAGDNRIDSSEAAARAYDQFLQSDLKTRLFGYGQDHRTEVSTGASIWQNVHSYKEFVFYFGFVGLALVIVTVVSIYLAKFKRASASCRWKLFVLLFLFLVSIYQRYDVTRFHYYCILFGGGANLALTELRKETVATEPLTVGQDSE